MKPLSLTHPAELLLVIAIIMSGIVLIPLLCVGFLFELAGMFYDDPEH